MFAGVTFAGVTSSSRATCPNTEMPKFIEIGQTVAEIWRLFGFQNGGRPPSWIFELEFLKVWTVERLILHSHAEFRQDGQSVAEISRFL